MTPDLEAAVGRLEKYLAEHAKASGMDPVQIHGLHIGDEREAVLTTTDLSLVLEGVRGSLPASPSSAPPNTRKQRRERD